jgi:tetratricopeptide (TPR) repeat protein
MFILIITATVLLSTALQDSAQKTRLSEPEFKARFERAFDAGEIDRIENLVHDNPTRFVRLFQRYAEIWIRVVEEPTSSELLALERARVLAEAVDFALQAPGLLESWERLESFDAEDRSAWIGIVRLQPSLSATEAAEQASPLESSYARCALQLEELGDSSSASEQWSNLGVALFRKGRLQEALDVLSRALKLDEGLGNQQSIAASLNNLGHCYDVFGQWEKTLDHHQRSLSLREAIGDPDGIATSLNNLGICYNNLGQRDKALDHHQRSLALREAIGDPQDIASSLSNLGSCYRRLGQYEKAIDHHLRSLAHKESIGNPQGIATSLTSLGRCYGDLGQLEKAIDYLQRSLALKESIGNPEAIASSLDALGTCYLDLGQMEKAIDHHQRSLALSESIGSPMGMAASLEDLGHCYQDLGRLEEAIDHFQRSLALLEPLGNPVHLAASLNNIGNCYHGLGQIEKAIDHHQRSLALKSSGNPEDAAASLHNLGICYQDLGRWEEAIDHFQRSLALSESLGNPHHNSRNLNSLSNCYAGLGQFKESMACRRKGFEALNSVSLRSLSAEEQSSFRQQYRHRLIDALKTALKLERGSPAITDAFWIMESLRCRSLLGELAARADQAFSHTDPELQSHRQRLLAEIENTRLRVTRDADPDGEATHSLGQKLHSLEEQLEEVTRQLRYGNPSLMELVLPEPAEVSEVQQQVLKSHQALLAYVLEAEQSYLWVLTQEDLQLHPLPCDAQLRAAYERLAPALAAGPTAEASFVEPARELYHSLLGPLSAGFDDISEWIIVADGFLGFLPFEVLLADDPAEHSRASTEISSSKGPIDLAQLPYLFRRKSISYAPSASFLVFHAQHQRPNNSWKKDALLLGDPVYLSEQQNDDPTTQRAAPEAESFQRLRGTRHEVLEIAGDLVTQDEFATVFRKLRDLEFDQQRSATLSASRFDLYLGEEVNEQRMKSDLRGYRILHLATHGYFDPEVPWFSGLVLSSPADAPKGEGFLNLLELGTLQLDAQIVFLSACETGKGELIGSEGVQSTARSFLTSGAQSVIATQWAVRDDVASTMARAFYRKLNEGLSPAEALRQVKLALIDGRDRGAMIPASANSAAKAINLHAHPSLWAPFVIYGGLQNELPPK